MGLTDKIYYIIETPSVDETNISTYTNGNSSNTISNTGNSTIYYSDIVSNEADKGCNQFNPSNMTNVGGITTTQTNKYTISNTPLSIYDITKYISNKYANFITDIQLIVQCNNTQSRHRAIPSNCTQIFQGYPTSHSSTQPNWNSLPLYRTSAMTDSSHTYRSKHLLQQTNDIKQLMKTYTAIIEKLKSDSTIPGDQIQTIISSYQQLLVTRNDMDRKLGEIYKYSDSNIVQSQYNLDKAVYTNVVLTILATSMIYVVFTHL